QRRAERASVLLRASWGMQRRLQAAAKIGFATRAGGADPTLARSEPRAAVVVAGGAVGHSSTDTLAGPAILRAARAVFGQLTESIAADRLIAGEHAVIAGRPLDPAELGVESGQRVGQLGDGGEGPHGFEDEAVDHGGDHAVGIRVDRRPTRVAVAAPVGLVRIIVVEELRVDVLDVVVANALEPAAGPVGAGS